ncbi:MAG: BrnT family toxin [Candidatus Sumerlaeota bacterium]|nr:BrnT family toxin [Candidatus Sumerlaeota bacterium]
MRLRGVIWKLHFVEKLLLKHDVAPEEVESILFGHPHVLRVERGNVRGEDIYEAFGRTPDGRHLVVFFVNKSGVALPISARDMTNAERRYYGRTKA